LHFLYSMASTKRRISRVYVVQLDGRRFGPSLEIQPLKSFLCIMQARKIRICWTRRDDKNNLFATRIAKEPSFEPDCVDQGMLASARVAVLTRWLWKKLPAQEIQLLGKDAVNTASPCNSPSAANLSPVTMT
jgi:hypothetical protein